MNPGDPEPTAPSTGSTPGGRSPSSSESSPTSAPRIPDHELLKVIGRGSYGEVWLARNILGEFRAVKVICRRAFEHDRPYERELEGIRRFEPVSRAHPSQLNVLHVGQNDVAGHFFYVMELADDAQAERRGGGLRGGSTVPAPPTQHSSTPSPTCLAPLRPIWIVGAACRSRSACASDWG